MRKLYISLLLPFFMLLVQQGAVWHELGHLVGNDTTTVISSAEQHDSVKQDTGLSADKLCEICLAFAQVSGTAKTDALLLSLLSFGLAPAQWVATPNVAAEAPALRNRGPPIFL